MLSRCCWKPFEVITHPKPIASSLASQTRPSMAWASPLSPASRSPTAPVYLTASLIWSVCLSPANPWWFGLPCLCSPGWWDTGPALWAPSSVNHLSRPGSVTVCLGDPRIGYMSLPCFHNILRTLLFVIYLLISWNRYFINAFCLSLLLQGNIPLSHFHSFHTFLL